MDRSLLSEGKPFVLRNARVATAVTDGFALDGVDPATGLALLDLAIVEGRFAAVTPDMAALPVLDLGGRLLLPGFVDMHVHLDKAFTAGRTGIATAGLGDAVRRSIGDAGNRTPQDLRARMTVALDCALAHGTVAMRTHLDSPQPPDDSAAWAVFDDLSRDWHGWITLQAVALMALERVDQADFDTRCAQIARRGGVLGSFIPPGSATPARLARLFEMAAAYGLDVDLHVDETLDAEADGLLQVARAVRATGFRGKVIVGHCCSLAQQPADQMAKTIAEVAQAGLSLVSLPLTNGFLQDRTPGRTPRLRGIAPVQELDSAGIPVAFASDNVRDAFFAYGDFDMLAVLRHAVGTAQLESAVGHWIAAGSRLPAAMMGLRDVGRIAPGLAADAVLFAARDWTELFARPQADRTVIRAGRRLEVDPPAFDVMPQARIAS